MAKVVLDNMLETGFQFDLLMNGVRVCAGQPTSYADIASKTLASGSMTAPSIGAGTPDGRQANYPAVTGMVVALSGTADHIVYVDTVNSRYWVTTCAASPLIANGANTCNVSAGARRIAAVA